MADDERQDPLERLRAADPAAGVEPRDGFADEVVARVTEDSPSDAAPVADRATERARRRPRWLPVAAVAASLVVVGGAGYAVGATTGGTSNLAGGAAPPITLSSPDGAGATEQGVAEPMPGGTSDRMMAGGADSMISPWGWGRNSFSASGLSDADGTARGYAYDARSESTSETVAALAAALGVEGTPELKDGAWVVGPQDGTAPSIWVSLDGTLGFSYSNPQLDPWRCDAETGVCDEPTGDVPGEQTAIDTARSFVTAAGHDPADFEFTTETYEGAVTRSVQAWPVVDGQRLDQPWSVEVASEGLLNGFGALADLIELGDYPIVSEQDAFERLSDPRFSAQMTIMPASVREGDIAVESPEWVPPTEPPAAPEPGARVSWPVNDVEIVDARLGLATQWQADGSVVIVPAYAFTDADGGVWSVIAVADDMLDFDAE